MRLHGYWTGERNPSLKSGRSLRRREISSAPDWDEGRRVRSNPTSLEPSDCRNRQSRNHPDLPRKTPSRKDLTAKMIRVLLELLGYHPLCLIDLIRVDLSVLIV